MSLPPTPFKNPESLQAKDEPIAPPLGHLAASGFKWSIVFSMLMRLWGLGSSILLARLLLPADYGEYAETFIAISLVSTLRDSSLTSVLTARQKELDRLESDGFWLSLFFGFVSALILAGVGFWWWRQPSGHNVARMLWLTALASPLLTMGNVSATRLQLQMRFTLNVKLGVINYLATTILSVVLASRWFGWGPYALMVPQIFGGLLRAACFIYFAPPRIHWHISRGNVVSLLLGMALLTLDGLSNQVVGQGDNFVITRNYPKQIVGLYSWGFNLAAQAMVLIGLNMIAMVLPTMAVLNDERPRQTAAYLRVCRTLAAIGLPFCFLQILFAQPIIKPLFSAKYAGAEPIVAIISLGMGFSIVNMFAHHLMLARRQNRLLAIFAVLLMVSFMIFAYGGVRLGGVLGVAWAVTLFQIVVGSLGTRLALGESATWLDVCGIFWPPLLACAGAAVPTMSMALLFPRTYHGDSPLLLTLSLISVFALMFLGAYALLIKPLAPATFAEIREKADSLTRKLGVRLV